MEPAAGGRDDLNLMCERSFYAVPAAMEPAAGGRDDDIHSRAAGLPGEAAMEPAAGGRDDRVGIHAGSRTYRAAMEPAAGGRDDWPTSHDLREALDGVPQWSPPLVGGMTVQVYWRLPAAYQAAMEPAAGGRDDPRTLQYDLSGCCGRNGARRWWAG